VFYLMELRAAADKRPYGCPKKPDAEGQEINKLDAVEGDVYFPEQYDLSQNGNEPQ